jgi:ferredoxin-NADP reductase
LLAIVIIRAVESETMSPTRRVAVHESEAELRLERRDEVADGVVALTLVHPEGGELPGWTPGAHIDLLLGDSLVRQYSLCSSRADASSWRIGVLLAPDSRGGSKLVHEKLLEGTSVRVRGPRNHFPLVSASKYLFIAGGIGITPILPMIESVDGSAEWSLYYGGRHRDSMAFLDELGAYGDNVTLWPQDEKGLLDLDSILGSPAEDTLVYCCGPEALLSAVEQACSTWPSGSLHIERFAPKAPAEPPPDALDTFEVVCQRSGVTVTIGPDDSILEVLEEEDVDVMGSCYEGTCGTCQAAVIEGLPDHRDSVLTEAEKEADEVMMICVSRSRSERLVLDV